MESELEKQHRLEAEQRLSNEGRKYFRFVEFDKDEQLITEIRKHFVGLYIILISGGFIVLTLLGVSIFAGLTNFSEVFGIDGANEFGAIIVLLGFLMAIGTTIATLVGAFLYKSNVIFVTNEKIAQVMYLSLFNRKISQLSIGDVQDVTVTQKGILPHAFNYGTLVIETAGEQNNYHFNYVPDPYQMSKVIVGAHEKNLVQYGN